MWKEFNHLSFPGECISVQTERLPVSGMSFEYILALDNNSHCKPMSRLREDL